MNWVSFVTVNVSLLIPKFVDKTQTIIMLPNISTIMYSKIKKIRKPNSSSLDPTNIGLDLVGSPNKYLSGPDLVIDQDTHKVAAVDNVSNTGNDPKISSWLNITTKLTRESQNVKHSKEGGCTYHQQNVTLFTLTSLSPKSPNSNTKWESKNLGCY